ncbi:MAG: transporter [Hydrocarboniphaga sp.]|uniref:MFS transporter n=1 Tax=Hydrocarboniphaga sp. TaxID=2033016 RepID=UPI00260EF389|nr:MFS transporter [Hydrocarboniphaga sp.]MDB5970373.1 transporter [Hydrocarboniphaga sp.]
MGATNNAAAEWRRFWFLPLVAALGYATSVLHVYSIGPFIAPLHQEFGWSRAQISAGITVSAIISGIFCIPIGMLVDRIGPRFVGLVGVLVMAAAFALLGTATGHTSNWLMLWAAVAVGTFWVQATVWTSAVASRFETSRGLAFALTLSGASVAATVFPMLATWLIGSYGWRTAFPAMAGIWAALVFPLLFLFFRGARDQGRLQRAAAASVARARAGVSFSEGLRSPALYKLLLASGLFSFTLIGALVHFVPILTDAGAVPLKAAGIASLIGIFSIVGRLGTGVLLDRFPGHRVGALAFLIPIIACALLLLDGANPISQSVAAAAFGLTVGSEVDVIAYLAAKHFGLKNFGALYGVLQMALACGTAFGPLAAGTVFDHYGSYAPFLMLTIALMAVSAVALFSLGLPPVQAAPVIAAHAGVPDQRDVL